MVRVAWFVAIVLAAATAQERSQPAVKQRPDGGAAAVPLSNEDAELVKELALLERLELLRNLELFEEQKEAKKPQEQ